MSTITVRETIEADIPAVTAIYNDAVVNGVAVWNDDVVDETNRLEWLSAHRVPGTVALTAVGDDGDVLGYATYGDFRSYDGFRHTVENSVYVDGGQRAGGVGTALMTALIDHARQEGKHVMVAAIEGGNTASIRLHSKVGFEECGTVRQVGSKFGRWLDMTLMQVIL
ncbi:MAG: GNAT family N-acetyltransferase [Mycobacteriaceae bacterium]|uniref:GNAT family N-acetyltransferase n=1 Tax=Corynebacterium sp. TaxID=1720 RepID=UPI003F97749A